MIVLTGIRSEIATEEDNLEIHSEEEEKINSDGENAGVEKVDKDGLSNDDELHREDQDLDNDGADETHEEISQKEAEVTANIADGAEVKEQYHFSKENIIKREDVNLNENIRDENNATEMNKPSSIINTAIGLERESTLKPKIKSLEITNITSQIQVKKEPASIKEINMQVTDVSSDVLNSVHIKTESRNQNDPNGDIGDNMSIEMTEIKEDLCVGDIKEEPGLDSVTTSSNEECINHNDKEDMFVIDGLVGDASDKETDTNSNSADSYNFDTYSIHPEDYNPVTKPEAQSKPRLKCNQCDKTYQKKSALMKHMQQFHVKTRVTNKEILNLECVSCEKKFSFRRSFLRHFKDIHNTNSSDLKLSCDMCKETFSKMKALDNHKNTNHSRDCPVCLKSFYSRQMLEKHISREHAESTQQFKCKRCKKDLPSAKKLEIHLSKCLLNTHEKKFQCDICKQSFRKNITLKKHKEESHVNKFSENVIISQASTSKHKQQHKRNHKGQLKNDCDARESISSDESESSKPFAAKDDDEDIIILDSVIKTPIQQIILPKNVILSKAVQKQASRILESSSIQVISKLPSNQVKIKVLDTEKGPFKCDKCSKVFSFRYSLEQHMKDHDKCTNCNAAFSSTHELDVHHIACHGDLCNRCELCNFCATDYSSLWNHLKGGQHAGVRSQLKPSKLKLCPVCKMAFLSQEGLEQHYKNHSPASTYVCEVCLVKFFTPASLDVHKVWEHQIQPRDHVLEALIGVEYYNMEPQTWRTPKGPRFICKICEFSVANLKEFNKHKKGFQHSLMRRCMESKHSQSILKKMKKTWKYHHCSDCNNSFLNVATLRSHQNTWHHPDFSLAEIEANQNKSTFSLAEVGRVAYHQDDVDIVSEIMNDDDIEME